MSDIIYRGCRFPKSGVCSVFAATTDWWAWVHSKERGRPLIRVFDAGINPATGALEEQEVPAAELPSPRKPAMGGIRLLRPRYDLLALSRDFDWACDSPSAYQLGLALLADQLPEGDAREATKRFREFTLHVVAHLPYARWSLSSREVGFHLAATFEPDSAAAAVTCPQMQEGGRRQP
jgi:hypothetical protein